jgi:hypothetical protein
MDEQSGSTGNRGELAEQILDRIASDGDFRQQLLDNPVEALKQAGYNTSDEVSGYGMRPGIATTAMGCVPKPSLQSAGKQGGKGAGTGGGGGVVTTAVGCGVGGFGGGGGGQTDPAEPYTGTKPGPESH